MGPYKYLNIDQLDGDILQVTIDRPGSPLNALNGEMHDDFSKLFSDLKVEQEARAVLLTGTEGGFCAGGDFTWFPTLQEGKNLEHIRQDAKHLVWNMLDVQIPIVTAINGPAMGLGASIALLSDVIFMADTAVVGDPHVKVGIVAGDGGTILWPLALGPARAKEFLLTGDSLTAEQAEKIGLVNYVCPPAELYDRALVFARRLAAGAPLAVQYTKIAINKWMKDMAASTFDTALALEILTFRSEDHREALAAWSEKRKPVFKGI